MIKKTKRGYQVVSKTGKNLGRSATKKAAQTRLRQGEYFKSKPTKPR